MSPSTDQEISCRITKTLLLYVRESHAGSLGGLLDGLDLDEAYLSDANNWVSHAFLQVLYRRMIDILQDEQSVYKMALASDRFQSLGMLDRIGRLLGNPGVIYAHAPEYNRMLKRNGDVSILDRGDSWVLLEDCYHCSEQKTRYDCDYTRGIITGIPTIFELPFAAVEELMCQVRSGKVRPQDLGGFSFLRRQGMPVPYPMESDAKAVLLEADLPALFRLPPGSEGS